MHFAITLGYHKNGTLKSVDIVYNNDHEDPQVVTDVFHDCLTPFVSSVELSDETEADPIPYTLWKEDMDA